MIKLVVFDLDNTLAFHGEGIKPHIIDKLRELENKGINVAFCSGKTAFYLSGFARQVGLKNPILVGENGAEIKFGIDLPPPTFSFTKIPKRKLAKLVWIEKKIRKMFNNELWFQHNRFGVSPFPRNEMEFEIIDNFIKKHKRKFKGLTIYRHPDCFDIFANEVNKKSGVKTLLNIMKLSENEMIAVGDGINDYPMFELAKLAVGVNVMNDNVVDINFKTIDDAMDYILLDTTLEIKTDK